MRGPSELFEGSDIKGGIFAIGRLYNTHKARYKFINRFFSVTLFDQKLLVINEHFKTRWNTSQQYVLEHTSTYVRDNI